MPNPRQVLVAALLAAFPAHAAAPAPGHVTGVGGVFIKSPNPKALAAWYHDMLGIELEPWGGAMLSTTAPNHPPVVVWNAFPQTTHYFGPSSREFMINFAVDNLDAIIARLKQHNVAILKRDDAEPNGKFAWIMDPDGTKLELWEPKPEAPK